MISLNFSLKMYESGYFKHRYKIMTNEPGPTRRKTVTRTIFIGSSNDRLWLDLDLLID